METPDPALDPVDADSAPEAGPRIVRSVARAAALLKALAARGKPMGLSDLARAIEISKPATFHPGDWVYADLDCVIVSGTELDLSAVPAAPLSDPEPPQ